MDSRLKTIMNFVPKNSRVADIGTDHGYLAIELIKQNIATKIIASDKNQLPLESARKNICEAGINDKIELRLGDGLQILNAGEVDVICIAGIGGSLMCDILSSAPNILADLHKMILQPMNAVDKVRNWLDKNNWIIEDEDLAAVDDIIYEILCVSKSGISVPQTKRDKSPLLTKFVQNNIDRLQNVVDSMSKSPNARMSNKYFELQKKIESLKISI